MTIESLLAIRDQIAKSVRIDDRIDRYIVLLLNATRECEQLGLKGMVAWGASPRGGIALRATARVLAYLRGAQFVSPDEIKDLALDALRHRIVISFDGESRGVTSEQVIATALKKVTIP
jgi:MoxR-like ATPase